MPRYTNWSSSYSYNYHKCFYPKSEEDIVGIVKSAIESNQVIRVIGAGHSCAPINHNENGLLISLKKYAKILEINSQTGLVKVQAGITLNTLCRALTENNLALENMGTIDAQSVAGALATGTHGSGYDMPALDQQVVGFSMINGLGEIISASEEDHHDLFRAGLVSLGALGIISTVTFQCVPNFKLKIRTHCENLQTALSNIPTYIQAPYLRLWWIPHTNKVQVWQAEPTDEPTSRKSSPKFWFKNILLGNYFHALGLWISSIWPTFIPILNRWMLKLLFQKSSTSIDYAHQSFVIPIKTRQMVMEYAIPIEDTAKAIAGLQEMLSITKTKAHLPIEIRFAPKNQNWLSMAHDRNTCYIGVIVYKPFGKTIPFDSYFEKVHHALLHYTPRPHWAKMQYFNSAELATSYPKWSSFLQLKNQSDPNGIFKNNFITQIFG